MVEILVMFVEATEEEKNMKEVNENVRKLADIRRVILLYVGWTDFFLRFLLF